ncbi:hypothetical protein [Vibrio crassostreae]|uniref:hypothetical protein n=1 Tax=Vibrio crassostreae TaxID=246167 RepID=UPI00104F2BC6|nr:hypothetical protein [Vibrio crassostreae]TCT61103.1 hypothetical protein EDB31_14524 [Vibrio crassostreae]
MKKNPEVTCTLPPEEITPPSFDLLFMAEGYTTYISSIKTQLKSIGQQHVRQCIQNGQIKRNKATIHIAIENYIDEIAIIIPAPIQLHSNYDNQAIKLASHQQVKCVPKWAYLNMPLIPQIIDDKALSLTTKKILHIIAKNTNLVSGECCLTCTHLYRIANIPRATIDKVMSSKEIQSVLVKQKFNGCKEMGFYWTEKGKALILAKLSTYDTKKQSKGFTTDWPIYSFGIHTALIKQLSDEYKKQLRNSQIPIVQREAAISLALLDAY